MRIDELPSMLAERVETGEQLTVYGRFDRMDGVRAGGYFRIARADYVCADLTILDATAGMVTFTDARDRDVARLVVGQRYTWFDDYWKAEVVEAIADDTTVWRQVHFAPRADGWDHEHCDHCGEKINASKPLYYEDANGNFLCPACYERYAAKHDVSFQVGG